VPHKNTVKPEYAVFHWITGFFTGKLKTSAHASYNKPSLNIQIYTAFRYFSAHAMKVNNA